MQNFLFYLGHPAHYHNLKNPINELLKKGHCVKVVARSKDVLFSLIKDETWDIVLLPERKLKSKLGLIRNILQREWAMLRIAKSFSPDLLVGTDLVITHVGKFLGVPSIIVNEDDSEAIPLMAKYAFPFASKILAPNCCDQSPANHKKIGYEGYHELAYLRPEVFTPDKTKLPLEFQLDRPYFILRFASLHAHHDGGKKGISNKLAKRIIEILQKKGDVFITSERELDPELETFRLPVNPKLMHHVLAFASGYIGDSQTMTAEAAVLGIPSIRFNDFVGELSYLEELESKYKLTSGIPTNEEGKLIELIEKWVEPNTIVDELNKRKKILLESTIRVDQFWVEVFENQAIKAG